MTSTQNTLDLHTVQEQLGAYYQRFSAADQTRHLQFLQDIRTQEDVALDAMLQGSRSWRITVVAPAYAGALSIIAGLLTAFRFRIANADVFTVRRPASTPSPGRRLGRGRPLRRGPPLEPQQPSRLLLDVFEVTAVEDPAPSVWEGFHQALKTALALLLGGQEDSAREQVIDRLSSAHGVMEQATQLLPLSIQVSNEASPVYTQLTVRSTDIAGFLFAFTNALTTLNVDIDRAEIRTAGGEVHNTFWLTDFRGEKITAPERLQELHIAAALIQHFTYLLPRAANPAQALRQFNALTSQMLSRQDWTRELQDLESAEVLETLAQLMGVSKSLWEDFLRMQHENLFPVLVDAPALERRRPKGDLQDSLRRQLHDVENVEEQVLHLNRFKDREMFRIDLRHITRRIDFRAFSEELSDLAEAVVEKAADITHARLARKEPYSRFGGAAPCPWAICALGKFGGRELGFGSDIELLFLYEAEDGTDQHAAKALPQYWEEFVRVFLTVIKVPREGIFEVDLRLRPYGSAGPLACSLDSFRAYYSERGDAWQFERMALTKLRFVAGDPDFAARVMAARDAFVYSGKPLDAEDILHLRHRQATELVAPGAVNAKYSAGGLVDVEYFTQVCQITAGHDDETVRVANTLDAIDRLSQGGHLQPDLAQTMPDVYGFLRRLIDALRAVRGHARDLIIPPTGSQEFAYLARRLQLETTEQLQQAIGENMALASQLWRSMGASTKAQLSQDTSVRRRQGKVT